MYCFKNAAKSQQPTNFTSWKDSSSAEILIQKCYTDFLILKRSKWCLILVDTCRQNSRPIGDTVWIAIKLCYQQAFSWIWKVNEICCGSSQQFTKQYTTKQEAWIPIWLKAWSISMDFLKLLYSKFLSRERIECTKNDVWFLKLLNSSPTMSMACPIFSNSSGQISGQWVKPKYSKIHLPWKSLSVTAFPLWSVKLKGPPRATFPIDRFFSFSLTVFIFNKQKIRT